MNAKVVWFVCMVSMVFRTIHTNHTIIAYGSEWHCVGAVVDIDFELLEFVEGALRFFAEWRYWLLGERLEILHAGVFPPDGVVLLDGESLLDVVECSSFELAAILEFEHHFFAFCPFCLYLSYHVNACLISVA